MARSNRAIHPLFAASFVAAVMSSPCAMGQTARPPTLGEPEAPVVPVGAPATRSMSLPDAIAYARAHQPAVLVGIARVAAQSEAAKIPRAQWFPLAGVSAQLLGATSNNTTAGYVTPTYMDIPRIGGSTVVSSGTWQPYASTFAGAGLQQEAFDCGRIAAQAAAADELVEIQKQSSANALLDVTYGVVESYFAVQAAEAILKAAEDAYARARVHRDLAKSGVTSGMRSPIELTRAEADLARFNAARIRAQGGVETAQAVYAVSVGVPDAALDVAGTPSAPPDLPALNDAIAQAGVRDPRILGAVAQLRAQEEETRAIRAQTRPDVSLTATISGRAGGAPPSGAGAGDPNDGWLPNVPNWDVGIVFSWPLLDPVVQARADASKVQEQTRREELAEARFYEVGNIRETYVSARVARERLPALEQELVAAQANWAQADARFRAGLGTAVELADAEAVLAAAQIDLALGVFEVARTRAAFGRAVAETV